MLEHMCASPKVSNTAGPMFPLRSDPWRRGTAIKPATDELSVARKRDVRRTWIPLHAPDLFQSLQNAHLDEPA